MNQLLIKLNFRFQCFSKKKKNYNNFGASLISTQVQLELSMTILLIVFRPEASSDGMLFWKDSHPVFSPKSCSSWILENWVRSPMFSTPRVSVMDVPSFPPRLRLKIWRYTTTHHHVISVVGYNGNHIISQYIIRSTDILRMGRVLKSCGTDPRGITVWRLGLFKPHASLANTYEVKKWRKMCEQEAPDPIIMIRFVL